MEVEIDTKEMIQGIIKIRQSIRDETLKLIKNGKVKTSYIAELVVLKTLFKLVTRWLNAEVETIEEIAKEKTIALKFTNGTEKENLFNQITTPQMYN